MQIFSTKNAVGTLEAPQGCTYNEYPQYMFSSRHKKGNLGTLSYIVSGAITHTQFA